MNRIITSLSLLFNIAPHEWKRTGLIWGLKGMVRLASVLTSTVLVALFIEHYSVAYLPLFYVILSFFVIGGSFIFSFYIGHKTTKSGISALTFITAGLLIGATILHHYNTLFYLLAFLAAGIGIIHLQLWIGAFSKAFFSPLEYERTSPVIESSDVIGSIIAGLILSAGITYFSVPAEVFLAVAGSLLLLFIPLFILVAKNLNPLPKLEDDKHEEDLKQSSLTGLKHIIRFPFLQGMAFIVFFQFFCMILIEFQYTSVIEASVHTTAQASAHHADLLTEGLAKWQIIFSSITLVFQMLLSSRILKTLGIIRTMAILPYVNIITSILTILRFDFLTAVLSRGLFEMSFDASRTAGHMASYALSKTLRTSVHTFLEGVVKPLGTLSGTLFLLGITYILSHEFKNQGVAITISVGMFIMAFVIEKMKRQYTLMTKKKLDMAISNAEKIEAIEILAQKGHSDVSLILGKNVHTVKHIHVQCKIIHILGKIGDTAAIPDIIKILAHENPQVQLAAVEALAQFKNLGTHFYTQSFARHRVMEALKSVFLQTKSKKIKSAIIQVFHNINNADVVPFLLEMLQNQDEDIVADAVYVCGLFRDMSAVHYLEPFIQSENPRIKSSAIIALWNFPSYRIKTLIHLTSMLESEDERVHIAGIYALGEIQAVQEVPRLEKSLTSSSRKIQYYSAIALAKMGVSESFPIIIDFLLEGSEEEKETILRMSKKFSESVSKNFKSYLLHEVSKRIHRIFSTHNKNISELPDIALKELLYFYELLNETKEVLKIEEEISKRKITE